MKACSLIVLGLLQACSGRSAGTTQPGDADQGAEPGQEPAAPGQAKPDAQVPGGTTQTCAADAQFDFDVWGDGLSSWDGRLVVAAAIENDSAADSSHRPVLLSSTIQDGAFSFFCPRSLHRNNWYPSCAVFVDVDGDGRCTSGDAAYQMQYFAWDAYLQVEIPADGWGTISPGSPGPPIGSTAGDFCTGYFD